MYSYDYYAYFEEHLCTAPSKLTLGSDCLGLCFWGVTLNLTLNAFI